LFTTVTIRAARLADRGVGNENRVIQYNVRSFRRSPHQYLLVMVTQPFLLCSGSSPSQYGTAGGRERHETPLVAGFVLAS